MYHILNLGSGVQSSTVLLMSIHKDLPPIQHAIFADTGWEPQAVYAQFNFLQEIATTNGIHVHRVSYSNIKDDCYTSAGLQQNGRSFDSMPYHTLMGKKKSIMKRRCTSLYKIDPINKKIKEILGLKPRQWMPQMRIVTQWFGISYDELDRQRNPDNQWAVYYYPLIDLKMTRDDCQKWLVDHGYPQAPRSACIGCPFHTIQEWTKLRNNSPNEFQEAVKLDEAIRDRYPNRKSYLHSSCKPLTALSDSDESEYSMRDECLGYCGM